MVRAFVEPSGPATIEDVLNHVANLVDVEHVGIGSDVDLDRREARIRPRKRFDLNGVNYSQKIFDLTGGLIRRKYSAENIELIPGGNFQLALAAIWLPEGRPSFQLKLKAARARYNSEQAIFRRAYIPHEITHTPVRSSIALPAVAGGAITERF